MAKNSTQDYNNYIDSSDMIIEYYKHQQTTGLEKYFLDIENWLAKDVNEDQNRPLVIEGEEGVGKKAMLVKWIEYHQQNSKKAFKDIILPHFAGTGGNTSNYYYAIYKILIKLREAFNISQKVELLEEKLRKYFYYWLDVCSRAIKSQVVNDSMIILIFEGINLFKDFETHEEIQISMWLPKVFPDRVRVIVTTNPKSQSLQYLKKNECEIIQISNDKLIIDTIINAHLERPSYISDESYKKKVISILNEHLGSDLNIAPFFVKSYLNCLLPYQADHIIKDTEVNKEEFQKVFEKIDFETLKSITTPKDLIEYILDYFSKILMPEEKYIITITVLILTHKGLSTTEIASITKINAQEWNYLLCIYKGFLTKYKGFWKINNEIFKTITAKKYLLNAKHVLDMHEKIADVLDKIPNSIKKLEEQTYHLFVGKNYFKLKEAISNIENFLLLFNPNNKYDLCRYWQVLEEKGFDPSMEYTKQIESFEMHYRPPPDDMFRIMIQISRFLKEFSDFETEYTPRFRHPPVKGGKELTEIGIRKEIKKMEMFIAEEIGENEEDIDEMEELEFELHGELKGAKLLDNAKEIVKEIHDNIKAQKIIQQQAGGNKSTQANTTLPGNANSSGGINGAGSTNGQSQKMLLTTSIDKLDQTKKPNPHAKSRDPPILDAIESLNVDIPDNRLKFRDHYLKSLVENDDKSNEKDIVPNKLGLVSRDEFNHSDDEKNHEEEDTQRSLQSQNFLSSIASNRKKMDTTTGFTRLGKIKQMSEKPPTFYYYKRWLWMMFPWACLAYKANFSQIIFECFSSPTRYMSVSEEKKYTQEALRITIEAKLKKKAMYAKVDESKKQDKSISQSNMHSPRNDISSTTPRMPMLTHGVNTNGGGISGGGTQLEELNSTRKSKQLMIKTNLENNIVSPIENSSPLERTYGGTMTKRNDQKQFFITTEFLNLNILNNSVNVHSAKYGEGNSSLLGETSIHAMNKSINKSRSLKNGMSSDKYLEKMIKEPSYSEANSLLPKFQFNMQEQNDRELMNFEVKVRNLQKELDDLTYRNKTMARRLKELTVNKHSLTMAVGTDAVDNAKNKILGLSNQIDKAKKSLTESKNEQYRFKKIIFICHKNKKQNETWIRELNYLLQNLKKMIRWENEAKAKMELQITEMRKLLDSYIKAYNDKFKNHLVLIGHLKTRVEAKDMISHKIDDVDNQLESSALETMEKINQAYKSPSHVKDQKHKMQQIEKNAKAMQEKLDQLTELYENAKLIIGDKGDDYENTPEFQNFLSNITRKNDLDRIIFEKREAINELNEKLKEREKYLGTLKKASLGKKIKPKDEKDSSKDDNDYDKTYFEDILRKKRMQNEHSTWTLQKNRQVILDSQLMLQKIGARLGIDLSAERLKSNNLPAEEIADRYENIITKIKENVDEETFQKFISREYDFRPIYKKMSNGNAVAPSASIASVITLRDESQQEQ